MFLNSTVARCSLIAALVLSTAACAPGAYSVKQPTPSGLKYESAIPTTTNFALKDSRAAADRVFSSGRLPAELILDGKPVDPAKFLSSQLQAELASRGVPVVVNNSSDSLPRIDLRTFKIFNWRATGFSPFFTLTYLSADIEANGTKKRVGVFVKRGKVPVWSFDEIVEPTLNQPLSLVVKEVASKIAVYLYDKKVNDATVDDLIARLSKRGENSYLDVYALGFTNNPKAIDTLAHLTTDSDEYVRIAAISSLGNIGAISKFDLLKSIYQNRNNLWQDRAMAIKALGDIDTADARDFLASEKKIWAGQSGSQEAEWTLQVINLYLAGVSDSSVFQKESTMNDLKQLIR